MPPWHGMCMAGLVNPTPLPQRSSPLPRRPRVAKGVHVRRASPKIRRELHAAQADEALNHRAAARRTAAAAVQQITGLVVGDGEIGQPEVCELHVEVAFTGVRHGRLTVGFSRGLTRQIGTAMAAMVDLDGRPLSPVEAAKDLVCAIAHAVLGAVFAAEQPRLQSPHATNAHRFGADAVVLAVADGRLVIEFHLDQSKL